MNVSPRHRPAVPSVAFALGILVGATVAWAVLGGRDSSSGAGPQGDREQGPETFGSANALDAQGPVLVPRVREPSPTPAAGTSVENPTRAERSASPQPLESAVAAWINVTIEPSVDWPSVSGTAYALPARAPGVEEVERTAHVSVSTQRGARLPVPAEGIYDVGFVWGFGWAFVQDVRVTATSPASVVLRPMPAAPVTVRLSEALPTGDSTRWLEAWVRLELAGPGSARPYPGRGERPLLKIRQKLETESGTDGHASPLPRGWNFAASGELIEQTMFTQNDMSISSQGPSDEHVLVAEPALVAAGGTLHLVRTARVPWKIRVRYEPTTWDEFNTWLRLEWHQGGEPEIRHERLQGAQEAEALARDGLSFPMAPGTGRLTWSGQGIVPGSLGPVELKSGAPREDEIVVRMEPEATTTPDTGVTLDLSALPPDLRRPDSLSVYGAKLGESSKVLEQSHWEGDTHVLEPEWKGVTWAIAMVDDAWVSTPERPALHGAWRPAFARGGTLVVMPDFQLSADLGGLRLRRTDGAPFGLQVGVNLSGVIEADVAAGTVLGPFPPGPVRFSVMLGSHALPDAVAEVRAGGATSLVLRLR